MTFILTDPPLYHLCLAKFWCCWSQLPSLELRAGPFLRPGLGGALAILEFSRTLPIRVQLCIRSAQSITRQVKVHLMVLGSVSNQDAYQSGATTHSGTNTLPYSYSLYTSIQYPSSWRTIGQYLQMLSWIPTPHWPFCLQKLLTSTRLCAMYM